MGPILSAFVRQTRRRPNAIGMAVILSNLCLSVSFRTIVEGEKRVSPNARPVNVKKREKCDLWEITARGVLCAEEAEITRNFEDTKIALTELVLHPSKKTVDNDNPFPMAAVETDCNIAWGARAPPLFHIPISHDIYFLVILILIIILMNLYNFFPLSEKNNTLLNILF